MSGHFAMTRPEQTGDVDRRETDSWPVWVSCVCACDRLIAALRFPPSLPPYSSSELSKRNVQPINRAPPPVASLKKRHPPSSHFSPSILCTLFQTSSEFYRDLGGSYSIMVAERKRGLEEITRGFFRPAGVKIYMCSNGESSMRCSGSRRVSRSNVP